MAKVQRAVRAIVCFISVGIIEEILDIDCRIGNLDAE